MIDARPVEALLDELAAVGRPRLSRMDDGTWHACLELPTPAGITAEVRSDYDHLTHRDALETVVSRLASLRRTMAEATPLRARLVPLA
jgi:hypothetical protein